MKKLLLLTISITLAGAPLCGEPFGIGKQIYNSDRQTPRLLIHKIIKGEPISYCFYSPLPLNLAAQEDNLRRAFDAWTVNVAGFLEHSGLAQKIPGVAAILARPVQLNPAQYACSPDNWNVGQDILIVFDPITNQTKLRREERALLEMQPPVAPPFPVVRETPALFRPNFEGAGPIIAFRDHFGRAPADTNGTTLVVMTHELGHAIAGLADEYPSENKRTNDRGYIAEIAHSVPVYNEDFDNHTIMSSHRVQTLRNGRDLMVGCDDMNGIITSVFTFAPAEVAGRGKYDVCNPGADRPLYDSGRLTPAGETLNNQRRAERADPARQELQRELQDYGQAWRNYSMP